MAFVVGGPKKKLAPRSSKSSKETFFAPEKDPFQNLLSLYTNAPTGEMTLEEFENAAVDRMTVLKEIDTVSRQPGGLNNPVYLEKIKDALSQYLPLISHGTARQETIRKDVLSHYALRLAFSHSGDKEWWIKQEQSLLSLRLQFLYSADLVEILNSSGLHYPQLSLEEWEKIKTSLLRTGYHNAATTSHKDYYLVPFEKVLDLVAHRKVFLRRGVAYVHQNDLTTLVLATFSAYLRQCLKEAEKTQSEDDRVSPLLAALSERAATFTGYTYNPNLQNTARVHPSQLDQFAATGMLPLCMKNMHLKLRENHHLKHSARMQYGLFLKGIGVSLEDSIEFWKSEFTRKMDSEKFERDHAYNIRHNYGKKGHGVDYSPYGCYKIINDSNPGANEHHGCPFKTFTEKQLRSEMSTANASSADAQAIIDDVKNHQYQAACRKYFELTHPGSPSDLQVKHPNNYYRESAKYRRRMGKSDSSAPSSSSSSAAPMDLDDKSDLPPEYFDGDDDELFEQIDYESTPPSSNEVAKEAGEEGSA